MRQSRAFDQCRELGVAFAKISFVVIVAIRACVQFDHGGPDAGSRADLAFLMADKQRDTTACLAQGGDKAGEAVVITSHIKATFCCALLALFGHDTDGVWLVGQRDGLHFNGCGHLEVERCCERSHQPVNICVADVAPVFAQVRCDAIRTCRFGELGRAHGIGIGAAAGVAHCGHVVDVYAQS